MAETALFSVAGMVLDKMMCLAIDKAYERVDSIRRARNELLKLKDSIQTIQAVLLDAEKQEEGQATVKDLIGRIRDVLYEADDLFDEVSTNELLKLQQQQQQQHKKKKQLKQVQSFLSTLNPLVANDSIAKKVKAIRTSLLQISADMAPYGFVKSQIEKPIIATRIGVETGPFVNAKEIFGRDEDKRQIMEFVYDDSYADRNISIIAIVGIGGMGKTALAQLVYNDPKIWNDFSEKRRWWACISNFFDEVEATRRIFQSMSPVTCDGLNLAQLQSEIRGCLGVKDKFLLVLDDLWDEENASWDKLLSLFSSCDAKGSKIIVTTRFATVANALNADKTHRLRDLSSDASWELFKKYAFSREQENDPNWTNLGRMVMDKCAKVPLAIRSIASLLSRKDNMDEWISFIQKDLSKITSSDKPISIMSALKLSYDYLPSNLKHCFAYCSLFQKDSILSKKKLVYLWIAQGFVKPRKNETLEEAGHAYFMELFRRSFFEEIVPSNGDILTCKMHDLAQHVSGTGSAILMEEDQVPESVDRIRHLSIGYKIDKSSWNVLSPALLQAEKMRSLLFMRPRNCPGPLVLDRQVTKLRLLRALNLEGLTIEDVPTSIGELKYLRYLNLSRNEAFSVLPDSITKLVNLVTLDVSGCLSLEALPKDLRRLVSLRHLNISECKRLEHMPPRFGELTSLQHLSDFIVSKGGDDGDTENGLDPLVGLNLQGQLTISYDCNAGWSEDEMMLQHGQIPENLQVLSIYHYPNRRIPVWWKDDPTPKLFKLKSLLLESCRKVKYLPPLRGLPFLGDLMLHDFRELEYIEEEEEVSFINASTFFPCLQLLELIDCPKLKGWSRRQEEGVAAESLMFPILSRIWIHGCFLLKSIPWSPHLQELHLIDAREEMVQHLLLSTSSIHVPSSVQDLIITSCHNLTTFMGQGLTSLRKLKLLGCPDLENVHLASNAIEELTIRRSPKLELWNDDHGQEGRPGVDWGSLVNLRELFLDQLPHPENLPNCLRQRLEVGKLQIK